MLESRSPEDALADEAADRRLDPRTKLAWLALVVGVAATTDQPALLGLLVVLQLGLVGLARLDWRPFGGVLAGALGLGVPVALVQGALRPEGEVLLSVGPLALHHTGLQIALLVALRLLTVGLGCCGLFAWTEPGDLVRALVWARVPFRYSWLIGHAVQFVPAVEQELTSIFEAQQARGLDLSGPFRKALAFGPVLLPLCVRTLRRADVLSLALELRGFGLDERRTDSHGLAFGPRDWAAVGAIVLLAFALGGAVGMLLGG